MDQREEDPRNCSGGWADATDQLIENLRSASEPSSLSEIFERLWNAQTDKYNTWSDLGLDEQLEFATAVEREACAVAAWMAGMDEHTKARGMPCDAREIGSAGARAIRMRSKA